MPDDEGGLGGMLCVVTEETDRVLGERRTALLDDLLDVSRITRGRLHLVKPADPQALLRLLAAAPRLAAPCRVAPAR